MIYEDVRAEAGARQAEDDKLSNPIRVNFLTGYLSSNILLASLSPPWIRRRS